MIFNKKYSLQKFFEFLYRNLGIVNILFPICYGFNAYAISSDTFRSLIWLGFSVKIASIIQSFVILGWLVLYLSSHGEKKSAQNEENIISETTLKRFIRNNFNISYLYSSLTKNDTAEIDEDLFKFLYSLTVFHYFKKSFAESIYSAINKRTKFDNIDDVLSKEFDPISEKLTKIEATKSITYCKFYFNHMYSEESTQQFKNEIESNIKDYIATLRFRLKKELESHSNKNILQDLINTLDKFSIEKRNKIITAINQKEKANAFFENKVEIASDENKATVLKLLLKTEHTYSLKGQRTASAFITGFGVLNAFCNGLIMLAGGYSNVGVKVAYLSMFSFAGLICSFMLTSPNIYKVIMDAVGHFENYARSKSKKGEYPSFIILLSVIFALPTAVASGIFAFFVLNNFAITCLPLNFIFQARCIAFFIAFVTFCGAFCLYFDSIFTTISSNKKDIYSPEDSIINLIISTKNQICDNCLNTQFLLLSVAFISASYILYQSAIVSHIGIVLLQLASLTLISFLLFPKSTEKYLPVIASAAISFALSVAVIHQIEILSQIQFSISVTSLLTLLGIITSYTYACTFHKGIKRFINKFKATFQEFNIDFNYEKHRERSNTSASINQNNVSITPGRKKRPRQSIITEDPEASSHSGIGRLTGAYHGSNTSLVETPFPQV